MGNCLQSSEGGGVVQLQRRARGRGGGEEAAEEAAGSVLKVKMVLTKGELEWLMAQLKAGDRRLEDVLQEMARKRDARAGDVAVAAAAAGGGGGGDGWRPSLESIVECPELAGAAAVSFD